MPTIAGIGQSNCASYALGTPPVLFSSYDPACLIWNSRSLDTGDPYTATQFGNAYVHPADHAQPCNLGPGVIAMVPAIVNKCATEGPARQWRGIMSPRGGHPFETDWWNASGRLGACLRFERILIAAGVGDAKPPLNVLYSQGWEASCNAGLDPADFMTWHKAMVAHLLATGRLAPTCAIILAGIHPNNHGDGDKVAWNAMVDQLAADYAAMASFRAASVAIDPAYVALSPLPGGPHWDAAGVWWMAIKVWQTLQMLGV